MNPAADMLALAVTLGALAVATAAAWAALCWVVKKLWDKLCGNVLGGDW